MSPLTVVGLAFATGLFAACNVQNTSGTATGGTNQNSGNAPVEIGTTHTVEFKTEPGQIRADEKCNPGVYGKGFRRRCN